MSHRTGKRDMIRIYHVGKNIPFNKHLPAWSYWLKQDNGEFWSADIEISILVRC